MTSSRIPDRARIALQATRPLYIPTSLLAGAVGAGMAIDAPGARWWLAPLALAALFFVHAGTNVINDVEDFARGVDTEDKVDNSRVFNTGLMSLEDGRRVAVGLFLCGLALGVVISLVQGPLIMALGVVGAAAGYFYSAGPRPLKYAGLGDAVIVPVMGPLITQGVYTAITGDGFHAPAFWLGFGPGLLIGAVLGANNLSDIPGDRAAGVRTLAVRLGFQRARPAYLTLLALTYATVVAVWAAGLLGWPVLVALLTLPVAAQRAAQALRAEGEGDDVLLSLAPGTAQLHLLFCLLLIAGVTIDRLG